jgi:hypothetical protein
MALDGIERRRFESGNPTPGGSLDLFVSLPAGFVLYGLRDTAASFNVGRQQPGPDYLRSVETKVAAKSADVLLPITSTNYGGLARQRLSPYLFSKPVCPLCTGSSETFIFCAECSHSTEEVSEWRCHRHEYRADL